MQNEAAKSAHPTTGHMVCQWLAFNLNDIESTAPSLPFSALIDYSPDA